jgi:5,10-methenyltetrahydromethanopterin hydrogenase
MPSGIKVTGMKEAEDIIKGIAREFEPNVFADWANAIEKTAKEFCHDPECKRIKFKHTQRLGFEFTFADKEAVDCVIKAINQRKDSMPWGLKNLYEQVVLDLENKKKEFKNST